MKKRIFILLPAAALMFLSACGTDRQTDSETVSGIETSPLSETDNHESSTAEEPGKAGSVIEITGGASMEDAEPLQLNTLYRGQYTEGEIWLSFTTSDAEDVPYSITLENLTVGSKDLAVLLYDENSSQIFPDSRSDRPNVLQAAAVAKQDGTANTGTFRSLQPNKTYYLKISGGSKAEYSLRINDPNAKPFDTTAGRTILTGDMDFEPAANMDDAPLVNMNTRYQGKYTEGNAWIAFITGDAEDVPYSITLENLTVNSKDLSILLYDQYGSQIFPDSRSDRPNVLQAAAVAKQDGTANTGTFKSLQPNKTYYLKISGGSKAEYTLLLGDSSGTAEPQQSGTDVPGTSMSSALNIPLGTKVFGKYTEGFAWLSFTTTEVEDAQYYVTLVNGSVDSKNLEALLYDEYGSQISPDSRSDRPNVLQAAAVAKQSGRACTGIFRSLQPNTTYYLKVTGGTKVEYSILISSPDQTSTAYSTSSSLSEAIAALNAEDTFYTGTNQNIATLLKTNTRYHGKYVEGYSWVAFTTGDLEDAEYTVTLENLTVNSKDLEAWIYDEYGSQISPDSRSDRPNVLQAAAVAKQDGTACTGTFKSLKPNTTYYLAIMGDSKAEYILIIGAPEPENNGNTIEEEAETVFEVPFELNETQVRFVADEAIFVDEDEARAALAPVAEIILAHPDHPILLAGTTAEIGTQEGCENLSNRRAAAVKDMLVNDFGVPESQLITVGLGYEKDPFVRGRDRDASGNFVETEAAKNRRVVALDAESDIARQILGN